MKGKVTEITMETSCRILDMTAQGSKNLQKHDDKQVPIRGRNPSLDKLKEDGIRKELYKIEWKAKESWDKKWGFLKNSKQLEQEEAAKQGLQHQILDLKRNQQMTSVMSEGEKPLFDLVPSKKVPLKTSEIIGWRLFTQKNELNALVGPMYVSPKLTMNPPSAPDEPELNQQKIIYLG